MSFCCGASMIGIKGTQIYMRTRIHNVPLLFCPVCHRVEVHYLVAGEYEILAEYAYGDEAPDVDFTEYVDHGKSNELYENCINYEDEEPWDVIRNQIDMALDLLMVAEKLSDKEWKDQLKERLKVLSIRRDKLKRKKAMGSR